MSNTILEVKNLTKYHKSHWSFKKKRGVKDLNFEIQDGECVGFIGHNGSGKTTAFKCITGLLNPNSGEIFFNGKLLNKTHQLQDIGFLPEQPYFYRHLNILETLNFFGALFNLSPKERNKRSQEKLELLDLWDRRYEKLGSLSKGLMQRVAVAHCILNNPQLLILDEPFSGLDPVARVQIRNILHDIIETGSSILISTHILSDVEGLCDRALIISKGELVKNYCFNSEHSERKFFIKVDSDEQKLKEALGEDQKLISEIKTQNNQVSFITDSYNSSNAILKKAIENQIKIVEVKSNFKKLEDIYLETYKENSK